MHTNPQAQAAPPSPGLHALIDRCVMCGLCSQHCPTYNLTQDENESPRGRIALISAASQQRIVLQGKARTHLEHCVGCRACEEFCPSGVEFGAIIDAGRAMIAATPAVAAESPGLLLHRLHLRRLYRGLLGAVTRPQQLARLGGWLSRYQRWGLQGVLRRSGLLKLFGLDQAETLLPRLDPAPRPLAGYTPPQGHPRGAVALFTGCITRLADQQALTATHTLLTRLGYGVHVPAAQTCCGALHQHSGAPDTARRLAQDNLAAFAPLAVEAILHTATGCTAHLTEYPLLFAGASAQHSQAQAFKSRVRDINHFLADVISRDGWPAELPLAPLPRTVLIHEPCSQRNVLRESGSVARLLGVIPQITLQTLPGSLGCCGAGGAYMLTEPAFSRQLRQQTLDAIRATAASVLVTSNVGCALQLAAGLREQGQDIEVLHPVTLLHRQLI